MPSSTSNFERAIPGGNWAAYFGATLLLTLALLGGWEAYWRNAGYAPTLNDTTDLWAAARTQLKDSRPGRTVLVGSSRMLFDFDLDVYARYFKTEPPIQLAVAGSTPLLILEHLADDQSFIGTVLCGVVPGLFFVPEGPPVEWAKNAINRYKQWAPSQRSGTWLGVQLEKRLAFLQQEDLTLNQLLASLDIPNRANAQIPPALPPYFQWMTSDRRARLWEGATFDTPRAHRIQQIWIPLFTPPPPPPGMAPETFKEMYMASVESYLERTRDAVDKIRNRGGRVVFIRCPSSGTLREMEARFSPRPVFWETILARTGAPGIHFEDHPTLSDFRCPEWSHLTDDDATRFTENLMPILAEILDDASEKQNTD
ncbi:MAG: hypothetical protein ACE5IY_16095 [bacterium]